MEPQHLEHNWVKRAVNGDRDAQQSLYNSYSKAMYNISIRLVNNSHDAEDILQDAFITAFEKIGQLKEVRQFGGWLKRIVINKSLHFLKKKDPWNELGSNEILIEDEINDPAGISNIPPEQVHYAVRGLPDGCRQVFVLYMMEGYKHREIAQMLGLSESTSKSQYIRAKNLLKERLLKTQMI